MKKKVVVIGGGNGSATIINALKKYVDDIELSAVISMSDSGGSSGRLRDEFDTLPPGDILRAVLAMSPYDYKLLRKIFNKTRFEGVGKLDGHNLGNLFLVLGEKYAGDWATSVHALGQAVEAIGNVYPVTIEKSDLCVELSNGDILIGEHEIDRPRYERSIKINRAWLQPTPMIFDGANMAIEEADYVIMGPGSLYSSVIATLCVEGMKKGALRNTKAKFIFVAGNGYEGKGETGPEALSDFVSQLENYLPRPLDLVLYNGHELTAKEQNYYLQKEWHIILYDPENIVDREVICADFECDGGGLDSTKLGIELMKYF